MRLHKIENILSERLKSVLQNIEHHELLQEIRLRILQPILIYYDNTEFFVNKQLKLTLHNDDVMEATFDDIQETLEFISKHSFYAYADEIRNGYITIEGGHRIGLAGKAVMEKGSIKTIRNISCINIRISHEVKGCANKVLPYIVEKNQLFHTLIISPPKCGKTTLLRDVVRQVSTGTHYFRGLTVAVVDERSEIGGCYRGIPQNDIGIRTDILDGCHKGEGMMLLIRAMAPQVIALDEIGSKDDMEAIEYALNSGCHIIGTVHGKSIEEIMQKPRLKELLNQKFFSRYIVLENQKNVGDHIRIYNEDCTMIGEISQGEIQK